jgi:hypothetical protein
VILHAAFIFGFYFVFPYDEDQFVWPGPRSLAANYLVTRLEPEQHPPDPPKPVATGKENKEEAAAKQPEKKVVKTATKNDEGAAGGKGETERARDPNAKDVPPAPPKVALMEDRNRKILDNILERDLATNLGKFTGIKVDTLTKGSMGFGPGHGTGVGDGTGTAPYRAARGGLGRRRCVDMTACRKPDPMGDRPAAPHRARAARARDPRRSRSRSAR